MSKPEMPLSESYRRMNGSRKVSYDPEDDKGYGIDYQKDIIDPVECFISMRD